ncbi:unnamed protein product [Mytilus edulis]|uniref:CCHC-type domain-containing protein n=1 Tax=Mytilus edulis TaxID=6550 RepID=A0A8S3RYH7_MYTED|nr:unnamed protein product [Mytilus edulis]
MDTGLDSPIREAIANEVKSVIASSQQDMLNNMSAMMDSRLNRLQSNIQQSQFDISNAQINKIEESVSDNYKFQRKGNENQFRHSVKVISKLTEARSLLDTPDVSLSKVAAAKDKISEGIDLVQERQKLIKLADSSELGWRVVQEYVTNPIADDSEDEKRMNRAQSRAERKSKAEKAKKRPRPVPYNKDRSSEDKNSNYKPGRCFTCGNRGHWSDNCPQNKKSKISTFNLLHLNNDLLSSESKINNVSFEHTCNILPSVSITSKYDIQNKNVTTEQLSSDTVLYLPGTPVGIGLKQNVGAAVEASGVSKDHILYDLTGKMSSFLLNSRSNNTNKTYFSSFNRWSAFIKEHGFNNLPAGLEKTLSAFERKHKTSRLPSNAANYLKSIKLVKLKQRNYS